MASCCLRVTGPNQPRYEVDVANNRLRQMLGPSGWCTIHPYLGVPFTAVLRVVGRSCFTEGPGWRNHLRLVFTTNVRTADRLLKVSPTQTLSATFTENGAFLPQWPDPVPQETSQLHGFKVTASEKVSGIVIQQWSGPGSLKAYAYTHNGVITAIGNTASWCQVQDGRVSAIIAVARVCLEKGPSFTISNPAGGKAGWVYTQYGWQVVVFYRGNYLAYIKPRQ